MATLDELELRLRALEQAQAAEPTSYYTSMFSGEEMDQRLAAAGVLGAASTPQAALANLGAGVRPNLLDNAYFVGGGTRWGVFPINQRGQSAYTSGYGIDRWYGTCNLSLLVDGISIAKSTHDEPFNQVLSPQSAEMIKGEPLTFSVLTTDGQLLTATGEVPADWESSPTNLYLMRLPFANKMYFDLALQSVNQLPPRARLVAASANAGDSVSVAAIKLELGEGQTLAYKKADGTWARLPQNLDYQQELAKCEYYHKRFSGNFCTVGFGFAVTNTQAIALFSLPNGLRLSSPTVTLSGTIYAVSPLGVGSSSIPIASQPTNASIIQSGNLLFASLNITGLGITAGTPFSLQIRDSVSYLDIAADF